MKEENAVRDKSVKFAVNIIKLCKYLQNEQKEYVLSRQLLKSGTSIGANIREAEYAQSKPDWRAKLKIAEKEANETEYWLFLLHETEYISNKNYAVLKDEIIQICRLLAAICTNSKAEAEND